MAFKGRKTDLITENYRCFPDGERSAFPRRRAERISPTASAAPFPDGERSGFTVVEWGGHAGQMSAKVP